MTDILEIRLIEFFNLNPDLLVEKETLFERMVCSDKEITIVLKKLVTGHLVEEMTKEGIVLYRYRKPECFFGNE